MQVVDDSQYRPLSKGEDKFDFHISAMSYILITPGDVVYCMRQSLTLGINPSENHSNGRSLLHFQKFRMAVRIPLHEENKSGLPNHSRSPARYGIKHLANLNTFSVKMLLLEEM